MKEVRISTEYLEMMLREGNILNYVIEKGLEKNDKIVAIYFNETLKELVLWCDTNEITKIDIELKQVK